jgi:predicted Rossmann fold nucleotide-binding protein DprA/Smf involved in DNA uptake
MAAKLTKRDLFNMTFDVVCESDSPDKEMICDFLVHEVSLIDKKRNAKKGPTAEQLANVETKKAIVGILASTEPTRAGDLSKSMDLSVQKVSALLRQLVLSGEVERIENGKVVTFTVK